MWRGSAEQFFELYATASTYLKEKFPHLKIGGYGSCGFYGVTGGNVPTYAATSPRFDYFRTFFDDFLAYVKAHNCPLDFFSWHSYDSVPSTGMFAAYARHRLDAEGFTETETTCDEWNCNPTLRGTRMHAALCTAMFAELQHAPVDSAMFYDGRCGVSMFSSLFNPLTEAPFPAYYAFLAFNVLYRLGQEVAVYTEQMGEAGQADAALRVLAARGEKDGAAVGQEQCLRRRHLHRPKRFPPVRVDILPDKRRKALKYPVGDRRSPTRALRRAAHSAYSARSTAPASTCSTR